MPSLLVHKSKPSQAELLVDGMEKKEKALVKALSLPGECLLATSHDADPCVVRMPLIREEDIRRVVEMLSVPQTNEGAEQVRHEPHEPDTHEPDTPIEQDETDETPFLFAPDTLRDMIKHIIDTKQETLSGLAKQIGVNKGQLYRFLRKGDTPSDTVQRALSHYVGTPETPVERDETDDTSNIIDAGT